MFSCQSLSKDLRETCNAPSSYVQDRCNSSSSQAPTPGSVGAVVVASTPTHCILTTFLSALWLLQGNICEIFLQQSQRQTFSSRQSDYPQFYFNEECHRDMTSSMWSRHLLVRCHPPIVHGEIVNNYPELDSC